MQWGVWGSLVASDICVVLLWFLCCILLNVPPNNLEHQSIFDSVMTEIWWLTVLCSGWYICNGIKLSTSISVRCCLWMFFVLLNICCSSQGTIVLYCSYMTLWHVSVCMRVYMCLCNCLFVCLHASTINCFCSLCWFSSSPKWPKLCRVGLAQPTIVCYVIDRW